MTGLNLALATPWNERSAIAHASAQVAAELSQQGHRITILRTETADQLKLPSRSSQWPVRSLADVSQDDLNASYDIVVAQIGDNFGFHGALVSRLRGARVIGIFHDAFIASLAGHWAPGGGYAGTPALRQLVHDLYGASALPPDEPYFINLDEMARRRPMLEWLARDTSAAIAHSQYYADRLRASCPGPVHVMPLAMTFSGLPPTPHFDGSTMTVAVVGNANPNKRIDQLILGIGASGQLRERCRIRVIGEVTPAVRERLTAQARALNVRPPEFTGWVTDLDLRGHLQDVDVMSCLRYPVLEGASASLILAMASGRPAMVSNHGCYAEVPDDAVLKCTPGHEALDVMCHLETLLENPARLHAIGEAGRRVATEMNAPKAYATALVALIRKVLATQKLLQTGEQFRETFAEFGLGPDDPVHARLKAVLEGLADQKHGATAATS